MKLYQATKTGLDGIKEIFDQIGIPGEISRDFKTISAKKWNVTLTVGTNGIIYISSSVGTLRLDNGHAQINMSGNPSCYAIMNDNYLIIKNVKTSSTPIILINTDDGTYAMSVGLYNYDSRHETVECTFNSDGKRSSEGSAGNEKEHRSLISGSLNTKISVNSGKAILYPFVLRALYVSENVFVVPNLYTIYSNVVNIGADPFTADGKQYEAVQIGTTTQDGGVIYYFAIPYQS